MKKNKAALLQFLRASAPEPLQFRELMQAFGVTKGERPHFKAFVDSIVEAGEIVKLKGNLFSIPQGEKGKGIAGRLSVHRDGYGFVTPDEGGEDIFIPARYLRENMHGDRVEVIAAPKRHYGKREGRIVKTIERAHEKVVGRFHLAGKYGRVVPDEQRITQDIFIPSHAFGKAGEGQVVVARITEYPTRQRSAMGEVVEVLGWPGEPEVEVQTIIRKYGLPHIFSPAVMKEARAVLPEVGEEDTRGREDLRSIPTVTIDGETARDFDDAVAIREESKGMFRLWVSIADVSHYVKPGSHLDREAYLRGTSVYFPDRCIPMLPEELSNGICSLNPQVDRLTMTAEMLFNRSGEMVESRFYQSVIRSAARLTYTKVKKIVVDDDEALKKEYKELVPHLLAMKVLAQILTEKRKKRGSIDFDLPEPEIVLDLQGGTQAIIKSERNLAHRLIEEFMLAANEAVASHLEQRGIPLLFRIHEPPDPLKLKDFQEFIFNFGYEFRMLGDRVNPGELQRLLEEAAGKPDERMVNEVLLRCMKQARYSAENLGHFGLAAPSYAHFTSPIRRYPDLVVHRILKKAIAGKVGEDVVERLSAELPEKGEHTSRRERVAMEAEREIVELKKLQFMKDKIGEEYDGFITGVTAFGFFVELVEFFVEGLVHITSLGDDYYQYREKEHSLVGERTKQTFRIGDRVTVRVVSVSEERRQIDFGLTAHTGVRAHEEAWHYDEYGKVPVRGRPVSKGPVRKGGEREGKGTPRRGGAGKGSGGRGRRR